MGKNLRRYKKPTAISPQSETSISLGPKEVSQMGAAVMILLPQICVFYFFYRVVPAPAEFDAHHEASSTITFATMYVGPPKIQYVVLVLVALPICYGFLKCCKGCLPGLIKSSMPKQNDRQNRRKNDNLKKVIKFNSTEELFV